MNHEGYMLKGNRVVDIEQYRKEELAELTAKLARATQLGKMAGGIPVPTENPSPWDKRLRSDLMRILPAGATEPESFRMVMRKQT
jgi:hypothetical protein